MTRASRASRIVAKHRTRLRLDRTRRQVEHQLRALRAEVLTERPLAGDDTDQCAETFASEVGAAVLDLEATLLRQVDEALRQVDRGRYGICAECGEEISRVRLRALPFAEFCRECQLAREESDLGPPAVRT